MSIIKSTEEPLTDLEAEIEQDAEEAHERPYPSPDNPCRFTDTAIVAFVRDLAASLTKLTGTDWISYGTETRLAVIESADLSFEVSDDRYVDPGAPAAKSLTLFWNHPLTYRVTKVAPVRTKVKVATKTDTTAKRLVSDFLPKVKQAKSDWEAEQAEQEKVDEEIDRLVKAVQAHPSVKADENYLKRKSRSAYGRLNGEFGKNDFSQWSVQRDNSYLLKDEKREVYLKLEVETTSLELIEKLLTVLDGEVEKEEEASQ